MSPAPTRTNLAPPRARDRRSTTAALSRLTEHREGARLLAGRSNAGGGGSEVKARPGAIRPRDRMFFFAQMSVMLDAGVPAAVALDGIARQCDRLRLREVLKDVLARVESGVSLSAALAEHPKVFPPSSVHLVRAGESSGDLPGMMSRINRLLERDFEMGRKLKSALTYPVVMLVLAVVTVGFLFAFILPRFRSLYAGKEDLLPKPTRMLLSTGDFVQHNAVLLGVVAAGVAVALALFLRTPRGRSSRDSAVLAVPVMGGVLRRFSLARSVRTLGALLQSGVPVLQALEIARDLASNQRLSEAWQYVRDRVGEGGRLHEGMAGQDWFPGTLVQMTAMGEAGGSLETVLVKTGEFYDREAEVAVSEATALIEPLMVVVVGMVVGFIAMSIMLPIFNMSKMTH